MDSSSPQITITDIKIPFMSMVVFMVKAAIAAIPAMIVLAVISAVFFSLLGGLAKFPG